MRRDCCALSAADTLRKARGMNSACSSAERFDALKDLGRILGFVEVDGLKDIVVGEAKRRGLARSEKVANILHLDKWHG